jgi:outer membrane lipoprotein SlyB
MHKPTAFSRIAISADAEAVPADRVSSPRGPRVGPGVVLALSALLALYLSACGASRPVVYGGGEVSRAAIDDCERLARQAGAGGGAAGKIGRDTAIGAAAGGAATGIYGAVRGYPDAGERAVAGAAAGAAVGLIRGAVRTSEPTPTFKAYVNRCLRERGYDVVGWN